LTKYSLIIQNNLEQLYSDPRRVAQLAQSLPAGSDVEGFRFRAFGRWCRICSDGIDLAGTPAQGVRGILISLYALHASGAAAVAEPFKAFKDFSGSAPYAAAFAARTEQVLVPHVGALLNCDSAFYADLDPPALDHPLPGDLNFVVSPLPKLYLAYICYAADEDFPASVRCLFSNNARRFMPLDALADVGEYTSREIVQRLSLKQHE
jgi:hypothetical protein